MKQISDLKKNLQNKDFYHSQFNGTQRTKILWFNPQLSGKNMYRAFFPYIRLYGTRISTAITELKKYNPLTPSKENGMELLASDLINSTHIVLPFSTQSFVGAGNLYEIIKQVNPKIQIVYMLDFNFWELEEGHPYKEIFTPEVVSTVEDNMFFSDMILACNFSFVDYIRDKAEYLQKEKYKGIQLDVKLACIPLFMDSKVFLEKLTEETEQGLPEAQMQLEEE